MRLRHLTTIVIALALCFAPIALDVCEAACVPTATSVNAEPAPHQHAQYALTSSHPHASGCHEAVTWNDVSSARVKGLPHACSHSGELPESAGACSALLILSPAVIATTVDLAVPTPGRLARSEPVRSTVSLRIALSTQLRV
jgi:hypothetical protein